MMYRLSEQNRIVYLLLLVLFSLPLTPAWGQSWETAYTEDFQAAVEANNLADVTNLVQSSNSFNWAKRGSTGNNNDICARKIFKNNQYIGFQLSLETGYEYRVSWNVKTLLEAKALDFRIGTDAASTDLISGPHAIPVVGANSEPGTVVTSAVFAVETDGSYVLIVKPSNSSSGTTGQTRFDDFLLERRLLGNTGDSPCICESTSYNICQGEQVLIGCEAPLDDCGDYCYRWSPSDGLIEGGTEGSGWVEDAQLLVAPTENTIYTLTVSAPDGEMIGQRSFAVNILNTSASISASTALFCPSLNNSVQLTASPTGAAYSYAWASDLPGSYPNTSMIEVDVPGTYTVTVTNTDNNCESTAEFELKSLDDPESALTIKQFFQQRGFMEVAIHITDELGLQGGESSSRNPTYQYVRDEANRYIQLQDQDIHIPDYLEQLLSNADLNSLDRHAFITSNDNFCTADATGVASLIEEIDQAYQGKTFSYWIHLWENPDGGEDCLFIQCITPTYAGYSPESPSMSASITGFMEEVAAASETYSYSNKDDQLFAILVDQLSNFYDTDELSQLAEPEEPPSGTFDDCEDLVTTGDNSYALNVAGLPITVVPGTLLSFNTNSSPNYDHDLRAVTGFVTPNGEHWLSYGIPTAGKHTGFKRKVDPDTYYPFPAILDYTCVSEEEGPDTYFGEVSSSGECLFYSISRYHYKSPVVTGSSVAAGRRDGPVQADFDPSGFCAPLGWNGDPIEDSYQVLAQSCIPHLSRAQFDSQTEAARFNPFGQYGIIFRATIPDSDGQPFEATIYGRMEDNDPATEQFTYYLWDCLAGWRQQTDIDGTGYEEMVEHMHLLAALYNSIWEIFRGEVESGVTAAAVHGALDIAGVIPVVGSIADLANGVWYLVEGDYGNASLALVGTIPLIGDGAQLVYQGTRAVVEYTQNSQTLRKFVHSIHRFNCVGGFAPVGGIMGMNALMLSRGLHLLPPCDAYKVATATLIRNIMEQAKSIDGGSITESHLTDLVRFIDDLSLSSGRNIAHLFNDTPELLKVWRESIDQGLSPAQQKRLFERLTVSSESVTVFLNAPNIVVGWKMLDELYEGTNIGRKYDLLLMQKTTELLDDATFLSRITFADEVDDVATQREALKRIIQKNRRASCSTCGAANSAAKHLDNIDEYLETVRSFANQHSEVEGYEDVLKYLRNGYIYQVDAANHTMRMALANPTEAQGFIFRFEPPLGNPANVAEEINPNTDFIDAEFAEVLTNNNIGDIQRGLPDIPSSNYSLDELKSYGLNSINKIPNTPKFITQLKAYLSNGTITDIDRMNYYFDSRKVVNHNYYSSANEALDNGFFPNADDALQHIKMKFQNVFSNQDNEIFDAIWENVELRASLFPPNQFPADEIASAKTYFHDILVTDLSSAIYSFIRVQ